MTFKYRKLTLVPRTFAETANLAIEVARPFVLSPVFSAGKSDVFDGLPPQEVNAEEGSGTLEELTARLKAGALMPSDLVFSNGSWTTFSQAAEFWEVCEETGDAKQEGLSTGSALWVLFAFLVFAGVFAYAMS